MDETTIRLVARCAKVPWLKEEEDGEPTPSKLVAKNLLCVEQPSAMASALSVVEVAAHMEKPGVQTPSLRRDSHGDGHPHGQEQEFTQSAADQSVGNGVTLWLNDEIVGAAEKSPFDVEDES